MRVCTHVCVRMNGSLVCLATPFVAATCRPDLLHDACKGGWVVFLLSTQAERLVCFVFGGVLAPTARGCFKNTFCRETECATRLCRVLQGVCDDVCIDVCVGCVVYVRVMPSHYTFGRAVVLVSCFSRVGGMSTHP